MPNPAEREDRMLHRLYARVLALAASPRAPWWLAAISFAESSFFAIPPDVLLIPMVLARPERAWR
jgi:membrane protein YqaA with SNARE-associated domain